jgi:DNA-binding NarL/FixJ family response regulator
LAANPANRTFDDMARKLLGVSEASHPLAAPRSGTGIRMLVVAESERLAGALSEFDGVSIEHTGIDQSSLRRVMSTNRYTWVLVADGLEEQLLVRLVQSARRSSPGSRIAMLGSAADIGRCERWLRRGVECYLAWPTAVERLIEAVTVATNQDVTVVDRCFQRSLLELAGRLQPTEPLTAREIGILRFVAQGFHNSEIGRMLQLGEHTVEFHVSNIISKLDVRSRAQAVTRACLLGLIALEEIQVLAAGDSSL